MSSPGLRSFRSKNTAFRVAVAAHAVLRAAERVVAMEDVEAPGVEVQRRDPVFVAERPGAVRVWLQMRPGPVLDPRRQPLVDHELDLAGRSPRLARIRHDLRYTADGGRGVTRNLRKRQVFTPLPWICHNRSCHGTVAVSSPRLLTRRFGPGLRTDTPTAPRSSTAPPPCPSAAPVPLSGRRRPGNRTPAFPCGCRSAA